MIDLKDLEYLLVISKTGAINKAANRLGLTQPALTRRIQKLEQQFGLQLLERQPKGIKLTKIGEEFLASSQKLLAHSRDFETEMKRYQGGRGQIIRIGIKPGLDDLFFTESLLNFQEKFPEAAVRISIDATPRLMRQLRNGEIDFALGALGYADDHGEEIIISQELSFSPMIEVSLCAYIHSSHPALYSDDPITALMNYPLVAPTPPLEILNALKSASQSNDSPYQVPQIRVDDFVLAAKIASQGHYWSAVYQPLFDQLSVHGEFVAFQTDLLPPLTIGLVQRKTHTLSPWAKELLQFITQIAEPWLLETA